MISVLLGLSICSVCLCKLNHDGAYGNWPVTTEYPLITSNGEAN